MTTWVIRGLRIAPTSPRPPLSCILDGLVGNRIQREVDRKRVIRGRAVLSRPNLM
jgi:hypothetical protein